MGDLKALIFDVDGTLSETEREGHLPAFNEAFSRLGLDWSWSPEAYGALLTTTGGKERIRRFMVEQGIWKEADGDPIRLIDELHREKTRIFVERMQRGQLGLRPGIKRLIEEARRRAIRLAIATTTTPDNVVALLDSTLQPGASDWFEVIAAGDMVCNKKPAPDVYLLALQRLDLGADSVVAFEDSRNGLRSALGAGIERVVITPSEYTQGEDFSGACLVVDQLGDPGAPCRILRGPKGFTAERIDVDQLRRL